MADTLIPQFQFQRSPLEMAYIEERLKQAPVYDPDIKDITDAVGGDFLLGIRPTLSGTLGIRSGFFLDSVLTDSASDPLNFQKDRDQFDPLKDPVSYSLGNNLDGITEDLTDVPMEERSWILSASNYNEYQRRLTFVKMGLPDAQAQASGWGFAAGMATDLLGLTAIGMAAEPLAIAGLGARTTLAGQAARSSIGTLRVQSLSEAAASAASTVGRTNLTARWAALGVAEEAVFQGVKSGLDPLYDPTAGEVFEDIVYSASVAGILGGAVFGRTFVRENIMEAASEFRSTRRTNLPGGYTVSYGQGLDFDSPAAADQMLFQGGSFADEASKIGNRLYDEWEQSPVEAVFTTRMPGEVLPSDGTRFRYTTVDGAGYEILEDGTSVRSGSVDGGKANRVYFVSARDANDLDSAIAMQQRYYPQTATSLAPNADNSMLVLTETSGRFAGRGRKAVRMSTDPKPGTIPVEIAEDGTAKFGKKVAKATPTPTAPSPFRSVIKTVAFEISLAGGKLTRETFSMIAKALVNVERRGLMGGAFNKALWEEISKNLDPAVAAALRKKKAFVGGVDRTVLDLVDRETMVDTILSMHRRTGGEGLDTKNSLIFRVLSEIRSRGGRINRETVADVVDNLRTISQSPPRRVNKAGKSIIDKNKRRLAVAQLINKHSDEQRQVFIPDNLINKMQKGRAAGTGGTAATTVSGQMGDFSDVPKVTSKWDAWWSWFGNQASRLMRSDNGAARVIGFHAFHAKRVFDKAQPQTIMEAGTTLLHGLMFTFLRGYRQGLAKFAMGTNGATPTLKDMLRTWGRKELRREFHKRVMRQMRSGAFNDASEAVNETAQGFKQLMNRMHQIAHEAGLKGFQNAAVMNYIPRLWRFDAIRRLSTTEGGKKALIQLIKKSLDQNGRRVVIDGVEQTFKGDIDEAATVFANRLINIANKTENAPLIDQEQELADALKALEGPVKGAGPSGGTPFGRSRTVLDESAGISTTEDFLGNGRMELSIEDLTNDDLPFVMRKYLSSIMGAVNQRRMISAFNDEMRARGVFGPRYVAPSGEVLQDYAEVETVEEMIQLATKIGGAIGESEEAGLRELMAAIRYEPIHHGPINVGRRLVDVALNYGYLTTGGQFGLAALAELSRIVGTLGIRKTIVQMPVLLEMVENWRNLDRDNQNFASLIDAWFSPSTDRMRRVFMEITPSGEYGTGVTGAVARGLNSASQVLSDISLLAPVTSFTQQLTAAVSMQHLYDVAVKGTKRLDNATVRALGLEPEQYEQVIQFVGKNAKTKRGFMGDRIVGMDNIDAKEMDLIKTFVQRMVESRIQSVPTRGDLHKSAFTLLGRIVTQFRTFNLKGVDNFLIQNVERVGRGGGAKVAQEIGATLVFAGLIQYARTYADWKSQEAAGEWEQANQTKDRLGISGFIRGAFTGPSEFFVPSIATDSVSSFLVGDPVFSPYRYSGLQFYGFPGEAQAINAGQVIKDLYGRAVGKPMDLKTSREITTSTIRKARLLLPGQNLPILKQYFNILESEIEDEFNLRRRQPRKDRD